MTIDPRQQVFGYGPRVPRYRRRWVRRVATYAAVAIALAAVVGWALLRIPNLMARKRVMEYAPPPDQVVFDNDPAEAARLIGSRHYSEVSANYKDCPGLNGAARIFSLGGEFNQYTAQFLHGRRAPGGKEFRLVQVAGADGIDRSPAGCRVSLTALCLPPVGVEKSELDAEPDPLTIDFPPSARLRIFAGQADPTDDSHFTIKYELNGVPGLIEGWLRNESYQGVELRITSAPAAPK